MRICLHSSKARVVVKPTSNDSVAAAGPKFLRAGWQHVVRWYKTNSRSEDDIGPDRYETVDAHGQKVCIRIDYSRYAESNAPRSPYSARVHLQQQHTQARARITEIRAAIQRQELQKLDTLEPLLARRKALQRACERLLDCGQSNHSSVRSNISVATADNALTLPQLREHLTLTNAAILEQFASMRSESLMDRKKPGRAQRLHAEFVRYDSWLDARQQAV